MKEPEFYIQKVEDLNNRLNEFLDRTHSSKHSLESLVCETELLFYGYSENFPLLLDIRQIKEKYKGWYYDHETSVAKNLLLFLSLFKTFINDNKPAGLDLTKKELI